MTEFNRKTNRLKHYDYNTNGGYFITICAKDQELIFTDKDFELTDIGIEVEHGILRIPQFYQDVEVKDYVIMPNHMHMILGIERDRPVLGDVGLPMLSKIMQQFKSSVTKAVGYPVWQKSFHDHVIRNGKDYEKIWHYIEDNPRRWKEDCYYVDLE